MADLDEFVVHTKSEDAKGRAFRAVRVTTVMADHLTEMGGGPKHDRPVYAVFAGSDSELRPFVANLLCGRPVVPTSGAYRHRGSDSGYEFMKSAGYKVSWQKHDAGSVATLFLPELCALDSGMVDPKGVKFVVLTGEDYLVDQAKKMPVSSIVDYAYCLPAVVKVNEPEKDYHGHVRKGWTEPLGREVLADLVPMSYLFTLYLSNRSRAPIPPDGRFYMQLLLACLSQGLASFSDSNGFGYNSVYKFCEETPEVGKMAPGIAFMADHDRLEALLAEECSSYFQRIGD